MRSSITRQFIALMMTAAFCISTIQTASAQVVYASGPPRQLVVPSSEPTAVQPDVQPQEAKNVLLSDLVHPCAPAVEPAVAQPVVVKKKGRHKKAVAEVQPAPTEKPWCPTPRAARAENITRDTPVVSHEAFLRDYPQMGEEGYRLIASINMEMCDDWRESLTNVKTLDGLFRSSDNAYRIMLDIYNHLPAKIKRATRMIEVTQVGKAGVTCWLSFFAYCLASGASVIATIIGAETNQDLQIANIRLSLDTIVAARLSIYSHQMVLRMSSAWMRMGASTCTRLLGTEFTMPSLREPPAVSPDFGKDASPSKDDL